jgi:hypothetical protein
MVSNYTKATNHFSSYLTIVRASKAGAKHLDNILSTFCLDPGCWPNTPSTHCTISQTTIMTHLMSLSLWKWEMTILVFLGICSEVTKKSMLSPHRSGNSLILLSYKVSENHCVQRQYLGTLILVNTTFSTMS